MTFRSAMCPNCERVMKLESTAGTVFCVNCGTQMRAEDAFVFYELKTGGTTEIDAVESHHVLRRCGVDFLEQGKYDLADSCFAKILSETSDDYQVWRLRAFALESKVVNGLGKSFYEFDAKKAGLVEHKEYLDKYREYCGKAVRYCPEEESAELADEFNEHIREHFNIAYRAYKRQKQKSMLYTLSVSLTMLVLTVLALYACRN